MAVQIWTLIVISLYILICESFPNRDDLLRFNAARCQKLTRTPNFNAKHVVGETWRIYYSWNFKLTDQCIDMTFQNVTPEIRKRFENDMKDFLNYQPEWDAATLHLTMGQENSETLLIPDQVTAGSFYAVPNLVSPRVVAPKPKSISAFKIFLKLLDNGNAQYLLMANCYMDITTLSALKKTPMMSLHHETEQLAQSLSLGIGDSACTTDLNIG